MQYFVGFVFVLVLGVLPWMGCGGDEDSGVCGSFCAQDAKCYGPEGIPNCVQYCNDLLGDAASECRTRNAELLMCVAELPSCDEVDAFYDGYYSEDPPDSYPCKAEAEARDATCQGV